MKILSLIILSITLFTFSCHTPGSTKFIDEGEIEYKITYPNMDANDIMLSSMMPKSMKMRFKDNNTISELKTGAGVFQTKFINQHKDKKLIHLVKLVNKKYGLILDSADIYDSYAKKKNGMTIEETQETKEIAGFKCHKVNVQFDNPEENFTLYYTKEIQIDKPNWCTPFYEIDGVLMEYEIEQYNVKMHLIAVSTSALDVEDEFIMPDDYEEISQSEMQDKFLDF